MFIEFWTFMLEFNRLASRQPARFVLAASGLRVRVTDAFLVRLADGGKCVNACAICATDRIRYALPHQHPLPYGVPLLGHTSPGVPNQLSAR